jgi:hypothetical protein
MRFLVKTLLPLFALPSHILTGFHSEETLRKVLQSKFESMTLICPLGRMPPGVDGITFVIHKIALMDE